MTAHLITLFDRTEQLSPVEAEQRYRALMAKGLLVFDDADELQFLAVRLGKEIRWQHKILEIGGGVWVDGAGRTGIYTN